MARPLRAPPPSSSVVGLLDMGAAARALAPPEPIPPGPAVMQVVESPRVPFAAAVAAPVHVPVCPTGEAADLKREFVLSQSTDEAFTELVDLLRKATGSRLTSSHVARALCRGLAQCMPFIEREARRIGRLKLPANARGREAERERFEERITQSLVDGIRASAAYQPNNADTAG